MQIKKAINVLGLIIALIVPLSSFAQNDSKANEAKSTTTRISKVVQLTPVPLRPDISVEKYMDVEPNAVRLLIHPVSGSFYYTTFDGGVFHVVRKDGSLVSEKIISFEDHGIKKLQGAVFAGSELFLCGNTVENNNRGTRGRLVRFSITPKVSL
jgi:hypothetical protein